MLKALAGGALVVGTAGFTYASHHLTTPLDFEETDPFDFDQDAWDNFFAADEKRDSLPEKVKRTAIGVSRFLRCGVVGSAILADYAWSSRGEEERTEEEQEKLISECHRRSGEKVANLCLHLGGVYIKLGQYLSTLSMIIPEEYVEETTCLRDEVRPVTVDELLEMLEKELDVDAGDIIESMDPEPIGCASLGQVHRARLKTGELVAMKFQYPFIRETSKGDVQALRVLFGALQMAIPDFKYDWLLREVCNNFPRELSFSLEVKNAMRIKELVENDPEVQRVLVPEVHPSLSTERIITMEYISADPEVSCSVPTVTVEDSEEHRCRGVLVSRAPFSPHTNCPTIDQGSTLTEMGIDVKEVATDLATFFAKQTFEWKFVHADPHPGNVLVRKSPGGSRKDGEIIILDHGLYREYGDKFVRSYSSLWEGLLLGDVETIKASCEDLGIGKQFKIFSSMVSARSWKQVERKNVSKPMQPTRDEMKEWMGDLSHEGGFGTFTDILRDIPSPMMLIFKVNDYLRPVYYMLNNPAAPITATTKHVVKIREAVVEETEGVQTWGQWCRQKTRNARISATGYLASWFL